MYRRASEVSAIVRGIGQGRCHYCAEAAKSAESTCSRKSRSKPLLLPEPPGRDHAGGFGSRRHFRIAPALTPRSDWRANACTARGAGTRVIETNLRKFRNLRTSVCVRHGADLAFLRSGSKKKIGLQALSRDIHEKVSPVENTDGRSRAWKCGQFGQVSISD